MILRSKGHVVHMVRYRSRRRTDRTVIVSREYHVTEVKVARIDLLARAVQP